MHNVLSSHANPLLISFRVFIFVIMILSNISPLKLARKIFMIFFSFHNISSETDMETRDTSCPCLGQGISKNNQAGRGHVTTDRFLPRRDLASSMIRLASCVGVFGNVYNSTRHKLYLQKLVFFLVFISHILFYFLWAS